MDLTTSGVKCVQCCAPQPALEDDRQDKQEDNEK